MTQAHPSLADQFAALRATLTAAPQGGMLHSALHLTGVWALFAAVFARLLDRLEAMLRLWQAGQFPPPPPPRASSRRPTALGSPLGAARPPRQSCSQYRRRARIARTVLRARAARRAIPRRANPRSNPRATTRAAALRTARRKPAARAPPIPHAL